MKSYEQIVSWIKENKQHLVLAVCFVLVFLAGFGSGRYEKEWRRDRIKSQTNYNTKTAAVTKTPEAATAPAVLGQQQTAQPAAAASGTPANCVIKGNISSSKKKIYHVPGGSSYNIVKPEQCFATEAEAVAAGYVKSQR